MERIQTKSKLEDIVLDKLDEHGWTVHAGERKGLDLDIDVSCDGDRGTIRMRGAITVPKELEANARSSPTLVRVDLGDPHGEPQRWSLWDEYEFPTGKDTPEYVASVVHEAYGAGWTAVVGAGMSSKTTWVNMYKTIDNMLSSAKNLRPGRTDEERQRALWKTQRHNFGPQRKKVSPLLYVFLLPVLSVLVYVLMGMNVHPDLPGIAKAFAYSIPGISAFGISIVLILPIVRWLRRPRRPHPGATNLVGILKATGYFDTFKQTAKKVRDGLPVITRSEGFLDESRAPMTISRVEAASSAHGLKLSADSCEVRWPDGVIDQCKVVPERWLLFDLTGSPEEVSRLPAWHRSTRKEDTVRWLIRGDEVEKGAVEDLFRAAAASMTGGAAPYR